MKQRLPILTLLLLLPLAARGDLKPAIDIDKQNQKDQGLEFTLMGELTGDGNIHISVRIPLKGKLQRITCLYIMAKDGNKCLFSIPLWLMASHSPPEPSGALGEIEVGPITISEGLIDKCSLYVLTGERVGDTWYRINVSSYVTRNRKAPNDTSDGIRRPADGPPKPST